MRAGKWVIIAAFLFLLTSCIYEAKFAVINKSTVWGSYNTYTKNISVTLPDGERFKGKYIPLDPGSLGVSEGSLFHRVDISTYLGLTGPKEDWKDWHAVLKGDRGTTMEMIFRYNGSQNAGYGVARTDTGGQYSVSF